MFNEQIINRVLQLSATGSETEENTLLLLLLKLPRHLKDVMYFFRRKGKGKNDETPSGLIWQNNEK